MSVFGGGGREREKEVPSAPEELFKSWRVCVCVCVLVVKLHAL